MALTDDEYKSLIVLEVGDTADQLIQNNIDTFWTLYDTLALAGRLQYLYAKRKAVEVLMGSVRTLVDSEITGDSKFALHQRMTNLETMLAACDQDIAAERRNLAGQGSAVGLLTTTAPIASPTGRPDANDPRYSGDPNWRSTGRGWW
jgi:hypothetical protein